MFRRVDLSDRSSWGLSTNSEPNHPGADKVSTEDNDYRRGAFAKGRTLTPSIGSSSRSSSVSSSFSDDNAGNDDVQEKVISSVEDDDVIIDDDDVFFDCRDPDYEIAFYVDGQCIYADGRPAFVPPGACVARVTPTFLEFRDFDVTKARIMWDNMQKWRQDNEIWRIHRRPDAAFHNAKRYYPSHYYGCSREGTVLEYSYPGQMKPKALFPNKTAMDEMLKHHVFMQEYVFNCLYTDEECWSKMGKPALTTTPDKPDVTTRGIIMVIDVKGAGPHLLNMDVFTFLKRVSENSTTYYPDFLERILIINSPFWVAGVFATIKPILPSGLPVEIVSEANTLEVLQRHADDTQIPCEYGGTGPYSMHQHPLELKLHQVAADAEAYGKESSLDNNNIMVAKESKDANDSGDETSLSTGASSSPSPSFDNEEKPGRGCFRSPFSDGSQSHQAAVTVVESEFSSQHALTLTPQQPSFDFFAATQNFWASVVQGFEGSCGGCRR